MKADKPAMSNEAPAGTDAPEEAGTSPSRRAADRDMDYISKRGTQKTHPNKPAQSKVLHHLG